MKKNIITKRLKLKLKRKGEYNMKIRRYEDFNILIEIDL